MPSSRHFPWAETSEPRSSGTATKPEKSSFVADSYVSRPVAVSLSVLCCTFCTSVTAVVLLYT